MKKIVKITGWFIILPIFLYILVFHFPFTKRAPIGAPTDYYVLADNINNYDANVFFLGDYNPLPDELRVTKVQSIMDVPMTSGGANFVVISVTDQSTITESDISILESLYKDYCYYILFINYDSSIIDASIIIEDEDLGKDIIFLDYRVCGSEVYSRSLNYDVATNDEDQKVINDSYLTMFYIEMKLRELYD